jgi:hypothetical protein
MADLITSARAEQAINQAGFSTAESTAIASLVSAVSAAVVRWCRRDFVSTSYDELYHGTGAELLVLAQYPVLSVARVATRPVTVLTVRNTSSSNERATVAVTSTGLTLVRVASGVSSTDTSVTWAGNPTLAAVRDAVNALGNGWSAQVVGDAVNYGSWPAADLYWPPAFPTFGGGTSGQGALQCVNGSFAELKMHTYELAGFQWDSRGWLLRAIPYTDPELLHPEDLIFPVGINNFRVQYTAGYATVPEAVQEACAEWVAALYFSTLRDPALARQEMSRALLQQWQPDLRVGLLPPPKIAALLAPYRRHTLATDQG